MSTEIYKKKRQNYRLIKDSILVELYKTPVTFGSLVLPTQKLTQQGHVIAVSEDLKDLFSEGDDVLIDPLHGVEVHDYYLFRKKEVLAIIES